MPSILGTSKRKKAPQFEEPNAMRMLICVVIIFIGAIWNFARKEATSTRIDPDL